MSDSTEPLASKEPDVGNVASALGDAYHALGLSASYYLSASDSLSRINARLGAVRKLAETTAPSSIRAALLEILGGS